ncbi:hypothetical protein JD844_018499 [Phrynosoma platyrhinos]|uniref:Suppressor of tumorigenicity 7 protein-like n=1 Tax=Phrynosoma platyrhinos TaxID=52577 RepID=A0ABQ7SNR8_PHRPL|nr:hypothetical protein JD844_018499 [Phrynosoma platyrhinos]
MAAGGDGCGSSVDGDGAPFPPSPPPSHCPGQWERLRLAAGPWARSLGAVAALGLLYFLRGPLRLRDNLAAVTVFLSTLTPKFYVALTGTSSLISGLIFIFEWWYFRKYGTSFIEQVSVSHLRPLIGGTENTNSPQTTFSATNGENEMNRQSLSECKVWRNPLNLFRGAEYSSLMYTWLLSDVMQKAWRERNPQARIKAAYQALELNNDCTMAYVLLAEEEATTIIDAEKYFKQALRAGETIYRKSQHCSSQSPQHEAQLRRDTNVLVYVKRRLAMCARKLGRIKEAVKMMRDVKALLELQAYADVQAVLAKYDDISLPKSAAICYTAALLKARAVSDR